MTDRTSLPPLALASRLSRRQMLVGAATLGISSIAVGSSDAQEAVTVRHFLGETVVPAKPQRVLVASDFTDLEYVLALGVTPVAYGFTGAWARGALPWQASGLNGVASFEVNLEPDAETIAGYAPDLIIGMSSYVEKIYEKLSTIAPTVVLDWSVRWRDGLRTVGQALFESEKAERAIAETEAFMAGIKSELGGLGGKKIMIGSLYGETLYVIGTGPIADQFAELGLTFVPAPGDNASASGLAAFSLENIDVLADADIILSFATDLEATKRLEAFAPFRSLPAVAGRAYGPLDAVTGSAFADNFSPLSARWVLPKLADLLGKLSAGQGVLLG